MTLAAKIWAMKNAKRSESQRLGHIKINGGIYRTFYPHGRNWYWIAHIKVNGLKQSKAFSISRLGETGARLAAALQRMCWLIDTGAWRPDGDNPLAILSYTDMLRGNRDYAESEVVGERSPHVATREPFDL